jgi:hypothetical protein
MKNIFALFIGVLIVLPASAQIVGTNSLSLQAVATTTVNGTAFSLGGISIPTRQHLIQNTGITGPSNGTNALVVNVQLSMDGSNWVTVSTYRPTTTNATVDLFAPSTHDIACYMRAQAVTTNTVTVGVTTIKP